MCCLWCRAGRRVRWGKKTGRVRGLYLGIVFFFIILFPQISVCSKVYICIYICIRGGKGWSCKTSALTFLYRFLTFSPRRRNIMRERRYKYIRDGEKKFRFLFFFFHPTVSTYTYPTARTCCHPLYICACACVGKYAKKRRKKKKQVAL